jgi:hypothetical protein
MVQLRQEDETMKFEDLYRPAALLGLAGATAVLGLAAGVAILRDPALARRLLSTGARGLERTRLAAAETVEEAIDLWEDVRAQARREVEDERFAAAERASATGKTGGRASPPARQSDEAAGAASAANESREAAGAASAPDEADEPRSGVKKRASSPRAPAASPKRVAKKPRTPRSPGAPRTPRA